MRQRGTGGIGGHRSPRCTKTREQKGFADRFAESEERSDGRRDELRRVCGGEGGADQKLDARGGDGRGGAETAFECGATAVHFQVGGGDAGRALGHWRDGGQRDSDEGRDYSGGGGR